MAKNNPHNLVVGQKLYVVYTYGTPTYLEVLKVGNKWATIGERGRDFGNLKLHLVDMYIDGGRYSSPGCAYLSEKDCFDEKALAEAWRTFQQSLSYSSAPKELTLDKIKQVRELLGPPYSDASIKR